MRKYRLLLGVKRTGPPKKTASHTEGTSEVATGVVVGPFEMGDEVPVDRESQAVLDQDDSWVLLVSSRFIAFCSR